MKMVKSLLLGSAAGLVAVAGAQAADLPVKAKPVEYVKVCSLYGAGYYYMPGTDICLKLGGYVRYQYTLNPGNSISGGPLNGTGGLHNRTVEGIDAHRTRAVVTVDTRQQTAYGTLRTYILLGFQQDSTSAASTSPSVYMTRGFLQIAGFTFGKATSFFDIYPNASFSYNAGFNFTGDTGDAGQMVAAYTAQFGNGVSATISAEQSRRGATVFTTGAAWGLGAVPTANNWSSGATVGNSAFPDIVANLRVDQAWGSVLIAGALHDASGGYYGTHQGLGHPDNELGWAITGGFVFNLPMIAAGDRFAAQAVYTEGATRYLASTRSGAGQVGFDGGLGFGWFTDGVYGGTATTGLNQVELTTGWSAIAAFEHFWTPALRTSVYGSYINISHNANAATLICASAFGTTPAAGCNPDWSAWTLGSRTQWEPIRGLIMGVDVIYQRLESARPDGTGLVTVLAATNGLTAGTYAVRDQDAWSGTFRIQRDFLP
jgi:hypothetical protein